MKNLFTLILAVAILVPGLVFGQAQRRTLIEEFTNASCVPCDAQNPAFNSLIFNNYDKVVLLKYQTSFPGFDPMNVANPTEVSSRRAYYGITGVPTATVDGIVPGDSYGGGIGEWDVSGGGYAGGPYGYNADVIDYAYSQTTPLEISVDHTLATDLSNISISITIKNVGMDEFDVTNTVLHTAIIEKEALFEEAPGSTSETDFFHVMRKMLPGTQGAALNANIPAGDSVVITYDEAIPEYIYSFAQLGVVAFVQNTSTKEVHQAGISEPKTLDPKYGDVGIVLNSTGPNGLCDYSLTPGLTVSNEGDQEVTAMQLGYAVDGGTVDTFNWTGSLMPGASTMVNWDETMLGSGESDVAFSVLSVNGEQDYNALNEYINEETFYTLADEPIGTELADNFESTSVEDGPEDAVVSRADIIEMMVIDGQWIQNVGGTVNEPVGAYANSNKSLFTGFWWWNGNGAKASATFQKIDLSTSMDATLTFDHAYCQYTSENDRLEIQVSTDCGVTWNTIYDKAGSELATKPAQQPFFIPTSNDWESDTLDLSAYDGEEEVVVRFQVSTDYGNNLYIDNITIGGEMVSAVDQANALEGRVNVFPNPAFEQVNIQVDLPEAGPVDMQVFDATGKLIETVMASDLMPAGSLSKTWMPREAGVYLIRIASNDSAITRRVTVVR